MALSRRAPPPPPLSLVRDDDDNPSPAPSAPPSAFPRPLKNIKSLSLSIPPSPLAPSHNHQALRRPSIVSLPGATISSSSASSTAAAAFHRKTEDSSPSIPYLDGPIRVFKNVWIGSDDNARDWKCLTERGIKYILNVAKELACPFDSLQPPPLRTAHSTSDLSSSTSPAKRHILSQPTYFHAHLPSGRPAFHYLKLPWSHGQSDLVKAGFPAAMSFVDQALANDQGVLIHCQCGVSRSATLTIALVMRAAANAGPDTAPEIVGLKGGGMHAAYAYVKEKSKWVGPNMSLIYQLLDYERVLQSGNASPTSSTHSSQLNMDELAWERRHQAPIIDISAAQDDRVTSSPEATTGNDAFASEAKMLDLEMEERNVARKASESSIASAAAPGVVWKSRFGFSGIGGRTRTGSTSSNLTTRSSTLSENVLEEDEEDELQQPIHFDHYGRRPPNGQRHRLSPSTTATEDDVHAWSSQDAAAAAAATAIVIGKETPRQTNAMRPLASKSSSRSYSSLSDHMGHVTSAFANSQSRQTQPRSFSSSLMGLHPRTANSKPKLKHLRPSHLVGILPPVPSSPVPSSSFVPEALWNPDGASDVYSDDVTVDDSIQGSVNSAATTPPSAPAAHFPRKRIESRKPLPPPLRLQSRHRKRDSVSSTTSSIRSILSTPSQTLFVFPPSPTGATTTMMLTTTTLEATETMIAGGTVSSSSFGVPFPTLVSPRVSTVRTAQGSTKSFIGLRVPPTPTTAYSLVEVRGMMDKSLPTARQAQSYTGCS